MERNIRKCGEKGLESWWRWKRRGGGEKGKGEMEEREVRKEAMKRREMEKWREIY